MTTAINIFKWIWRAWPLLSLAALGCAHYIAVACFEIDLKKVNDFIALATQIVGGILILYSIDSTIWILRGASSVKEIVSYLKEFPLIKRSVAVQIGGAATLGAVSSDAEIITRMPKSIEKQILYLQNQIESLKAGTAKNFEELKSTLNKTEEKLNKRIDEAIQSIQNIELKVTEVSLGGVKTQILGVLLMIYGSVTSYVA